MYVLTDKLTHLIDKEDETTVLWLLGQMVFYQGYKAVDIHLEVGNLGTDIFLSSILIYTFNTGNYLGQLM